jgi:hypothetical protein
MREKARRALATARNSPPHLHGDSAAWGIKQEEIDDEFTVFAGRTKVFRPGGGPPPVANPQASMNLGPTPDDHAAHQAQVRGAQVQSTLGEWLAQQEQYVGCDPHYIAPIEPPPPAPHHQHQQYGYAPEQPQYTLEVVPPLQQYISAPYTYAQPPHSQQQPQQQPPLHSGPQLPPLSSSSMGGHHGPHGGDLAEFRRGYAAAAVAPQQTELAQLGLASSGSRMNETWMSFMLDGGGGSGRHM